MSTLEEFMKLDLSTISKSIGDCGKCNKPITDVHPDDVRMIGGKVVHDACYDADLSDLLEQHPPGIPGSRR